MWTGEQRTVALILVSCATVLTLVSCSLEIFALHKLPERMWRKMFARQLVLLATSDMVMAMTSFYWVLSDASVFLYTPTMGTHITWFVQAVCEWSGFTSVMMELHISFGLACSWARFEWGLRVLDFTVCSIPVLGVLASVIILLAYPLTYEREGNASMVMSKPDPLEAVLGILAFLSCLVAIACALWSTQQSTPAAVQGVQNRLWMYPTTFLISFGCRFAVDIHPTLVDTWLGVVYPSGIAANGLLNALIYFHQSRLSKRRCYHVNPETDQDVQRLANIHSFHAIFLHDLVQVQSGATYNSSSDSRACTLTTSLESEVVVRRDVDHPSPRGLEGC